MSTISVIPYSEEWSIDLSSFADLNREVLVRYRNGFQDTARITSSKNLFHLGKVVVTFNAITRAWRDLGQDPNPYKIQDIIERKTIHDSHFYQKDGRINNRWHKLSDDEKNEYDIIAVSLRLSGDGRFMGIPNA